MDPSVEQAFEDRVREMVEESVKELLADLFRQFGVLQLQMEGKPPEELQAAMTKLLVEWLD